MNSTGEEHVHSGHRKRMKDKLERHGQDVFDTYELLEMVLYHVIPHKDTNPLAKRLLARFGSLDGVLSAEREELVEVAGVGEKCADFLIAIDNVHRLIGAEYAPKKHNIFDSYTETGEYLIGKFKGLDHHRVMILMFDNRMHLIGEETVADVDYERGSVTARFFIEPAIRSRAAVVITAHNHPHGPFVPTPGDRETNALITDALHALGIVHLDHFLVSGKNYIGILHNFGHRFSQFAEIGRFVNSKRAATASSVKGAFGEEDTDA